MPGNDVEMPGVDVEMPGVDVEMPLVSVLDIYHRNIYNYSILHQDTIPKVSNCVLWQDHKPVEDNPAMLTEEEVAASAAAAVQIYAGKTDGEQDILQAGICHKKESMSCWIFLQLQAQARVREVHRDLQAREMQEKQEKKEKLKQKRAAEQQKSEPAAAVEANVKNDEMDPAKQENHPEKSKIDPPPAKKLKKSQAVSYASADVEAFFQSPATTAPNVQNPGIKFDTICHLKCTWHIQSWLINKFECKVLEKLQGLGNCTVPSGLLERNKKSFTVPAPPDLQGSQVKSIEIKFWPYLRALSHWSLQFSWSWVNGIIYSFVLCLAKAQCWILCQKGAQPDRQGNQHRQRGWL